MQAEPLEELVATADDFTVALRIGHGFSDPKFQALCNSLRACAELWAADDSIPKLAANVLVDLWPSIQACSYLYSGDEADRIMKAADEVADLTRTIVAVE